ncbi:MAG: hypothetical protein RMJ36_01335 [Candidatus Calescibacterium sp.]|nr:hypothetical protein [Candidatus Calescibacterium sp.]MDW8132283.1 hypothetical protein [Candidatus Calescibacterium sp.]
MGYKEVDIVIIGAGITGLVLASLIPNRETLIFEEDEIGGKIRTMCYKYKDREYFIELGPESIVFDRDKLNFIEGYFPDIFEQKKIMKRNKIYIADGKEIYFIPSNISDFIYGDFMTFSEKVGFLIKFLFNKFIFEKDFYQNCTLYDYSLKRFGRIFSERVIFPIFESVFGIDSKRLILKFVYPFVRKFENEMFYRPVTMFTSPLGLSSIVNKLSQNKRIVKEKIHKIIFDGNCFFINDSYKCKKVVFTGEASRMLPLLKEMSFYDKNIELLCQDLSALNYHSSMIHIFILNKIVSLKSNGVIFRSNDFVKSITFFSKKWYEESEIEVLRVFSKTSDYSAVFNELSKFFGFLNYDFENSIIDYYSVFWDNSILDYDSRYLDFYLSDKYYLRELEKMGIFIFGSFLGGTGIVDRIVFVLKNFRRIL